MGELTPICVQWRMVHKNMIFAYNFLTLNNKPLDSSLVYIWSAK